MKTTELSGVSDMLDATTAATKAEQTRVALRTIVRDDRGASPEITCEECASNDVCGFAFDVYNTDGDCLAVK